MKSRRNFYNSISFRLVTIFTSVMFIIMIVNIYIYLNVNRIVDNMNTVYDKNFVLNNMYQELQQIQGRMTEYLENKNTDVMEEYYKHAQNYEQYLDELNQETVDDKNLLMEKNIYNISLEYLKVTENSIDYKRGRNIVKYRISYDRTTVLCGYLLDYIDQLNNSLFISSSTDYQTLMDVLRQTQRLSVGLLLIAIILTIMLIMFATNKITSPLKKLAKFANEIAGGNLDIEPVEISTKDEVGIVTNAFNKMLSSIREYIEQIKENMERERVLKEKELLMDTHLKEARLNYLRAQVDPHFLFNTLNAGAQLAMMEDADRTYNYIQNVAQFYRYNVRNNKAVSLKEEINLVDNYMYIIGVRYSGDIHYSKRIEEGLDSVTVPPMILQPIVENSVKHGVMDTDWQKEISVSVWLKEDNVYIKVHDNGVGISEDVIESIFSSESAVTSTEEDSNGVGLKNVLNRLRLFYGKDDVMDIISEGPDKGTDIILIIPYDDGGSDV